MPCRWFLAVLWLLLTGPGLWAGGGNGCTVAVGWTATSSEKRYGSTDPAGYVDGTNLYCGYFAPNGVDPFGLEETVPEQPVIPDNVPEEERDEWLFRNQRKADQEWGVDATHQLRDQLAESILDVGLNAVGVGMVDKASDAFKDARRLRKGKGDEQGITTVKGWWKKELSSDPKRLKEVSDVLGWGKDGVVRDVTTITKVDLDRLNLNKKQIEDLMRAYELEFSNPKNLSAAARAKQLQGVLDMMAKEGCK